MHSGRDEIPRNMIGQNNVEEIRNFRLNYSIKIDAGKKVKNNFVSTKSVQDWRELMIYSVPSIVQWFNELNA